MGELFVMDLRKAQPMFNDDGLLTSRGRQVVADYARRWLMDGARDLDAERLYPELDSTFYDVRVDMNFARDMAG